MLPIVHFDMRSVRKQIEAVGLEDRQRAVSRSTERSSVPVSPFSLRPGMGPQWSPMSIGQDVLHGMRSLRKAPGFSAIAVLVLALGIGINTAIFSIVNAVLFRTLPVESPEELGYVYRTFASSPRPAAAGLTAREMEFLRDGYDGFAGITGHLNPRLRFEADGEANEVSGEAVLANYFDLLGVRAALGRTFRPEEDQAATTDFAIVISHDMWTRRFRADPGVIGKQVRLALRTREATWGLVGIKARASSPVAITF